MADKQCPLYKEPCMEHKCGWFINLLGTNPQTGASINEWGCAVSYIPILLIENAKETRQTAAAVESSRNEAARCAAVVVAGIASLNNAVRNPLEIVEQKPKRLNGR